PRLPATGASRQQEPGTASTGKRGAGNPRPNLFQGVEYCRLSRLGAAGKVGAGFRPTRRRPRVGKGAAGKYAESGKRDTPPGGLHQCLRQSAGNPSRKAGGTVWSQPQGSRP